MASEEISPGNATIGATILSDMIQARSGTVTPPKPALPRMVYERMMTRLKNRSSGTPSVSIPYPGDDVKQ